MDMRLMNTLLLSCVRATALVEQKEFIPLCFMQKMQLQMHIALCSGCKNYKTQTALINKLLNKTFYSVPMTDTTELEKTILSKIL